MYLKIEWKSSLSTSGECMPRLVSVLDCRPPLIYLVVKKPSMRSGHFWASWAILISCMIVTVLGAVGALRAIVVDSSTYHFYQ